MSRVSSFTPRPDECGPLRPAPAPCSLPAAPAAWPLAPARAPGPCAGTGRMPGGSSGGRAFGAGAWHPLHQRLQVDLLHYSAGNQEFVGRLVGFVQFAGQDGRHGVVHQRPGFAGHVGVEPLVDQNAGDHIGQQNVAAGQFLATLKVLNPQTKFVELGGGAVQHLHGQSGGQDLVVDGTFSHEFELARNADGIAGIREAGQQRALQRLAALVEPGGLVFLEGGPGVAPGLDFSCGTGLVQHRGQPRVAGLDDFGKGTSHMNHEEFTCLFGQGRNVLIGWRHNAFSMTRMASSAPRPQPSPGPRRPDVGA